MKEFSFFDQMVKIGHFVKNDLILAIAGTIFEEVNSQEASYEDFYDGSS